jgi:hypothetical protein
MNSNVKIDGSLLVTGSVVAGAIGTLSGGLADIDTNIGDITSGTITLGANDHIKAGQTAYNTGTGFFLGYSGATYKFSIGNAGTNALTWDGSTLTVKGSVRIGDYQSGQDVLLISSDAVSTHSDDSQFVKVKEFTMTRNGSIDFKFDSKQASTPALSDSGQYELRSGSTVIASGNTTFNTSYATTTLTNKTLDTDETSLSLWVKAGSENEGGGPAIATSVRNVEVYSGSATGESVAYSL